MNSIHKEFPESINWNAIDSILGSELGNRLAVLAMDDQKTKERLYTPGLRLALNVLYDYLEEQGKV